MRSARLLFVFAALSVNVASADELTDGIKAYSGSDFGTSIRLLTTATKGKHAKNATAHYYLGNAHLQTKNAPAALTEYRESLRLAPQAESATHCRAAILHLTVPPAPPVQATSAPATTPVSPQVMSATALSQAAPIKVTGLPSIPSFPNDDGPRLSDVLTWSQGQQSTYFQVAFDRKNEALLRLERTQDVLKRAQSLASSAVPSARQFGETDAMLKTRMESGRSQMATILKPFEDAVEARQKDVSEANSIYETCISSGRRLSGY